MTYRQQNSDFGRLARDLPAMQAALREAGLGGWLLFDVKGRNEVAGSLLGHGAMSRRWFVLVPAEGEPTAITHGIEQGAWEHWRWRRHRYVGWQQLEQVLQQTLAGVGRVAMEFSPGGAVPLVDLVPAGIIEMVRATGVEVVGSADLITRFHSRWSPEQLASHRTAAAVLAQVAQATFVRLARAVEKGDEIRELAVRDWVLADLRDHGVAEGADAIAATGLNAADPHYSPVNGGATFQRGDIVLLDLWAKQSDEMVFADQTWMACLAPAVPERIATLFGIVCAARDAAVDFLRERWRDDRPVQGREVDDVARDVIASRGYGAFFIHRTGHSIDRATHGMGPNIDNLETRDTRLLLPGCGFSIEPGIYIPGDVGMRTEINVFMGEDGPEVTTPSPQRALAALLF